MSLQHRAGCKPSVCLYCMRSYKMWDVTEASQRPSIKLKYTEAGNFTQIGHQHGQITTVFLREMEHH